jgi:endoglycosylceramidase
LASWGFNLVRLTIFWEAIEPQPDYYDQSYLNSIKDMVDQAGQRGIYVLLDMHQDLYSRHLKGDGAPAWTFPKDVNPQDNDGFGGQFWGLAYNFSKDVRACFTHFFRSKDLWDHYRRAWAEVAKRVLASPWVLGYDVMNEPFGGNIPNWLGEFENQYLKPFYQDVIASIRQIQPSAVGFVEPHILDMYTSKLTPFDLKGLVYAPHLYNPLSVTLRFDPLPEDMLFRAFLTAHKAKAEELGMPLFVGEFGAPWTMEPFYARDMAVNSALEALEEGFISNAYWDYSVKDVNVWNEEDFSIIDQEGSPRGLKVNVRPYVRTLQGLPLFQSFNRFSKRYHLRFKSEPGAPPTVLHIPEGVQYPRGFRISVSDGWTEYNSDTGELFYYPSHDGSHRLAVKPKGL